MPKVKLYSAMFAFGYRSRSTQVSPNVSQVTAGSGHAESAASPAAFQSFPVRCESAILKDVDFVSTERVSATDVADVTAVQIGSIL